jgi:hypothetical protein
MMKERSGLWIVAGSEVAGADRFQARGARCVLCCVRVGVLLQSDPG